MGSAITQKGEGWMSGEACSTSPHVEPTGRPSIWGYWGRQLRVASRQRAFLLVLEDAAEADPGRTRVNSLRIVRVRAVRGVQGDGVPSMLRRRKASFVSGRRSEIEKEWGVVETEWMDGDGERCFVDARRRCSESSGREKRRRLAGSARVSPTNPSSVMRPLAEETRDERQRTKDEETSVERGGRGKEEDEEVEVVVEEEGLRLREIIGARIKKKLQHTHTRTHAGTREQTRRRNSQKKTGGATNHEARSTNQRLDTRRVKRRLGERVVRISPQDVGCSGWWWWWWWSVVG